MNAKKNIIIRIEKKILLIYVKYYCKNKVYFLKYIKRSRNKIK